MSTKVVEGMELRWERLHPGRPPHGLGLFVPARPNSILQAFTEEEAVATDDRLPYFATLWPAAVALSRKILDGPSLAGLRVLDLGCGLGAVGIAAAQRGANVVFLDWEPRALAVVEQSIRALGLSADFIAADWREPPDLGRFPRIYAADVLYEDRNLPAVAAFVREHLTPDGEAWIADPGRRCAGDFTPHVGEAGLRLTRKVALGRVEDSEVEVRVLGWVGGAANRGPRGPSAYAR